MHVQRLDRQYIQKKQQQINSSTCLSLSLKVVLRATQSYHSTGQQRTKPTSCQSLPYNYFRACEYLQSTSFPVFSSHQQRGHPWPFQHHLPYDSFQSQGHELREKCVGDAFLSSRCSYVFCGLIIIMGIIGLHFCFKLNGGFLDQSCFPINIHQ